MIETAGVARDGGPVSTFDLLVALLEIDPDIGWQRVQLQTNFIDEGDREYFDDPEPGYAGASFDVMLSGTAVKSLAKAVEIADNFDLTPIPPAVIAIGLLHQDRSAAARALTEDSESSAEDVAFVISDEVLGTNLGGLQLAVAPEESPRQGRTGPSTSQTPEASMDIAVRALARARLVADSAEPSSYFLLLAALDLVEDEGLQELLTSMLMHPNELREYTEYLGSFEDVPATEVIALARDRFERNLGSTELIAAVALRDSPRIDALLNLLAVTPGELAAQMIDWQLRSEGNFLVSNRVMASTVSSAVISAATTAMILIDIDGWSDWWKVPLVFLAWTGYPQSGFAVQAGIAALFAVVVSPLAGAMQLVSAFVGEWNARTEIERRLSRTGVRLPARQQRHVSMRLLNARGRKIVATIQAWASQRRIQALDSEWIDE